MDRGLGAHAPLLAKQLRDPDRSLTVLSSPEALSAPWVPEPHVQRSHGLPTSAGGEAQGRGRLQGGDVVRDGLHELLPHPLGSFAARGPTLTHPDALLTVKRFRVLPYERRPEKKKKDS